MILHGFRNITSSQKVVGRILAQGVHCSRNSSSTCGLSSKVRPHVDRSRGSFILQRRRNLSVNPMFPERAIPDKHKISEEADFLTRHGMTLTPPFLTLFLCPPNPALILLYVQVARLP